MKQNNWYLFFGAGASGVIFIHITFQVYSFAYLNSFLCRIFEYAQKDYIYQLQRNLWKMEDIVSTYLCQF
jgi:hypothetical protein